jgi:hypothetical protein
MSGGGDVSCLVSWRGGTCYRERARGGGKTLLRTIGGMRQGSKVENGCGIQMI